MIAVTYAQGLFCYLVFWLLILMYLYWRSSRRRYQNHRLKDSLHLFSCDRCHYTFLNKDQVNLVRCPRCNAICIRRRVR